MAPRWLTKYAAGFRVQRIDIDHGIVEQPAGEQVAQRGAPALVAISHVLVDQGMQSLLERDRRVFRS